MVEKTRRLLLIAMASLWFLDGFSAFGQSFWNQPVNGSWNDPFSWNPIEVPNNLLGGNFFAIIETEGAAYEVALDVNITVDDFLLTSTSATVDHTAGEFSVLNFADISGGVFRLDGGSIVGGSWLVAGNALQFSDNVDNALVGVSLDGDLNVGLNSQVRLQNGTTVAGGVNVASSTLVIEDNLTFSDNAFQLDNSDLLVEDTRTLTLGPLSTVVVSGGFASIGDGTGVSDVVVNEGSISINSGPTAATIAPSTFDNRGTVEVSNGADLVVSASGSSINTGTYRVSGGSALSIDGVGMHQHIGSAVLTGDGTVLTGEFTNEAIVRPGDPQGALTISGDYTQASTGVLENGVSNQLSVTGDVTLAGQLNLLEVNGPAVFGTTVTVVTSGGPAGVVGQFDSVVADIGPFPVAVDVVYNASSVDVNFVAVQTNNQFNGISASTEWGDGSIWSLGVAPGNVNQLSVANQLGVAQQINVTSTTGNVQVHQLEVLGGASATATTTLRVTDGAILATTTSVEIGANAELQLGEFTGEQGSVVSGEITISQDGVVRGNGTLQGNVTLGPGGELRPGFSDVGNVTIDGDYVQQAGSVLQIELEDDMGGEVVSDTLTVRGRAELGGALLINATGANLSPGDTFEILDADEFVEGERFEAIQEVGGNGTYVRLEYNFGEPESPGSIAETGTCTGACGGISLVGDMDGKNGLDFPDIDLFAMALIDPDQYYDDQDASPDAAGDMDGNNRLDFDDIEPFAIAHGISTVVIFEAIEALSVPEPSAGVSALILLGMSGFYRGGRRRSL